MKNLKYRKGKIVEAKNDSENFYKKGDRMEILRVQDEDMELVDYYVINLRTRQKYFVWENEVN